LRFIEHPVLAGVNVGQNKYKKIGDIVLSSRIKFLSRKYENMNANYSYKLSSLISCNSLNINLLQLRIYIFQKTIDLPKG